MMLIPVMHLSPPPADRIWRSQSFNVGTAGAKIFSGPAAEEFGYTVQQATNYEGKWYGSVFYLRGPTLHRFCLHHTL